MIAKTDTVLDAISALNSLDYPGREETTDSEEIWQEEKTRALTKLKKSYQESKLVKVFTRTRLY